MRVKRCRQLLAIVYCLMPSACLAPAVSAQSPPAKSWLITLEEPTGIYRRANEIVNTRLHFATGEARAPELRVIAPDGQAVLAQLSAVETYSDGSLKSAELLFPATLIPGERPQFRLVADAARKPPDNASAIVARRVGVSRVELANERFGILLNLGLEGTEPALVAAFNKTAGEQRMLNLIDLTPEVKDPPVSGKPGAGFGSFLAGQTRAGAFEQVEILEAGPLRARVRLTGARLGTERETWEFVWHAGSPVLQWRAWLAGGNTAANYGFFFNAVSATPNVPFDRWMEGSEAIKFPDGWETDNPPDHLAGTQGARAFDDLPGRHFVFYQRAENYGALGFFELEPALVWRGVGAPQFTAHAPPEANKRALELALSFPRWKGTETVLEARAEYRRFTQPILSVVSPSPSVARDRSAEAKPEERVQPTVTARPVAALQREDAAHILAVSLDGAWKLNFAEKAEGERQGFYRADYDDSGWRTVQVPGSAQTQWLPAAQLYTRAAEWVSAKEWWYRRAFRAPAGAQDKRLRLRFEATDYYADIYLNGALLGRHEGYIDPYEFDVGDKLKLEGENVLAVRVWTPVSYYWRHRPWTIKGSYGAVDQKPDNITPLGITRPVHLLAGGPIVIREVALDTQLQRDGSADVLVDLTLDSSQPAAAELTLTLTPRNFDAAAGLELKVPLNLAAGATTRRFVLHVEKPQLWWTWDHGKPNLYTLTARVTHEGALSDSYACATGIREIEHVDWKFYLNGKRMFIRGTNSYYHLFLSEMRRGDYERDLRLMRGLNINMIRLHCHFSNPEFYDLADEMGILIWQDFLEAAYPEDRAFALKAAALYDQHIRYVRNHPAVALWATSDEESLENYRVLTKHLEPRLYALDPQRRPVVRSTGRYGDGHIYYGWYGGSVWEYAGMNEKFVSELGATALPDYESLSKFLPNHWPIKDHEAEWIFRKLQIPEAMRAWGEPGTMTLQEYIPQTQAYVARLFQLAIERMRRQKYNSAGGILHFHALDLWPSVTMAALDFYRRPTKAYATVQRSFQMVLPSFAYDRDTWSQQETVKTELWLINDHWHAVPNVQVTWRLADSAGRLVTSGRAPQLVTLAADSSVKLLDVIFPAPGAGNYTLWASITDERGQVVSENNYEFKVK